MNKIKKPVAVLLLLYLLTSLPITAVFVVNEYFRFQFFQVVSHWYSKIGGVDYVFIGDSIMAGGRNWNDLHSFPFNKINLAGNGYVTRQVISQAKKAKTFHPKICFVLTGANDVFSIKDSIINVEVFRNDFVKLVEVFSESSTKPVFTLIPYQSSTSNKLLIDSLNVEIKNILEPRNIRYVDLNPKISKNGILLDQYTIDGVHLSKLAYDIWSIELKKIVND